MIAIVDYGAGNLASVVKAVRYLGRECVVTCDAEAVLGAEKLIIPGVGNFHATLPLSDGSVGAALRELIATQKPVLGICLGLQWMFEGSEEASELPGLGVFPGKCVRFSDRVKSPHVGWAPHRDCDALAAVAGNSGRFVCVLLAFVLGAIVPGHRRHLCLRSAVHGCCGT